VWPGCVSLPEVGLALVAPDGSGLRELLRPLSGSYDDPSWSPDGSKLAFIHDRLWEVGTLTSQ
jgi:Tol biopolymer transport system component